MISSLKHVFENNNEDWKEYSNENNERFSSRVKSITRISIIVEKNKIIFTIETFENNSKENKTTEYYESSSDELNDKKFGDHTKKMYEILYQIKRDSDNCNLINDLRNKLFDINRLYAYNCLKRIGYTGVFLPR